MTPRAALALLLALALQACGGGATEQCTYPVRIQLFGDSTQWGYLAGGNGARADEYPEKVLQGLMDARFGEGCVSVSTRAVSGTNSQHLLAGTDGLNLPWPESVSADIVVINHGVNDVAWGIDAATYRGNLRKLSHARNAAVVLQTPLPVSTASVSYASDMLSVATEEHVVVADANAYAQRQQNWWKYAPDGVHATSEGYRRVATDAVMPVLEPIVLRILQQQGVPARM
jgi:lysophospholipase L1-like esterase